MSGNEARQVLSDARLAARDDRRVGDRQAERVAEQGRHSEPVGNRTDHRRFSEGREIAPGRVARFHGGCDDIEQRSE